MSESPSNSDPAAQGRDPLAPEPHPPLQPYGNVPAYGAVRSGPAAGAHRVITAVAGLLLGGLLLVTAGLMTGAATFRLQRFDFSLSATLPLIGFSLLSAVVLAGLAVTARFSSAGLYVAGAGHLLAALMYQVSPAFFFRFIVRMGDLARGVDFYLIGGALLVGATLIAFGVVASGLRRKARTTGSVPAAFR